jgi:hypothetical protein
MNRILQGKTKTIVRPKLTKYDDNTMKTKQIGEKCRTKGAWRKVDGYAMDSVQ